MIGPKSSGRMAASIMTAHPAWQLPMTAGLPSASRMERDHALEEGGLRARDVLDRLPGHGLGQEADEVAGMTCLEGNADLALRP